MIRKNEVRIGDYMRHGEMIFEITDIDVDLVRVKQVGNEENTGSFTFDDIEGVPITADLLKSKKWVEQEPGYFVFKGQNPAGLSYIDGLLDIECPYADGPGIRVWLNQDKTKEGHPGNASHITYFHQLQNLIFGVTTKELSELIK